MKIINNIKYFPHSNGGGLVSELAEVDKTVYVAPEAIVHGGTVKDNVKILDNAQVFDNAIISDNAEIYDNAQVFGNSIVTGNAKISGDIKIETGTHI